MYDDTSRRRLAKKSDMLKVICILFYVLLFIIRFFFFSATPVACGSPQPGINHSSDLGCCSDKHHKGTCHHKDFLK